MVKTFPDGKVFSFIYIETYTMYIIHRVGGDIIRPQNNGFS